MSWPGLIAALRLKQPDEPPVSLRARHAPCTLKDERAVQARASQSPCS
jgi:hypothetical protein